MSKKFLKDFDPKNVAFHEYQMWRFYYQHNFFRLFLELVAFFRSYFGLGFFGVLLPAYYAAAAATQFRKCKGRESEADMQEILQALESFYRIISNKSFTPLESKKIAALELHWWLVDRYPTKFTQTRVEAISYWAAALFAVDPAQCMEFATHRSEAMELQDLYEHGAVEAIDWPKIRTLLEKSYVSLYKSIHNV